MSTRILIVDYVVPGYVDRSTNDQCVSCPRHDRKKGTCQHFGKLALKPNTKSTYLRAAACVRAEERTRHAGHSNLMLKGDFDDV